MMMIIIITIIIIVEIKELTVQHHCLHQLHRPFCETSEGKSPRLIQVQGVRWMGTGIQVADGFHLKPAVEKYGAEQIGFGPHTDFSWSQWQGTESFWAKQLFRSNEGHFR